MSVQKMEAFSGEQMTTLRHANGAELQVWHEMWKGKLIGRATTRWSSSAASSVAELEAQVELLQAAMVLMKEKEATKA